MEIAIRSAREGDLAALVVIEAEGHETLRRVGAVPDAPSDGDDGELRNWLETGIVLVAVDATDRPLGYAGAMRAGDCLHVCQIDVCHAWQRRGIGSRLMAALVAIARHDGRGGVTLTTDRNVSFNAPFYATLGFRVLDPAELSEMLRTILEREAAHGLDPARRCAMRLDFLP